MIKWITLNFCIWEVQICDSAQGLNILTYIFHEFPLQANSSTVPQIRSQLLLSASFTSH